VEGQRIKGNETNKTNCKLHRHLTGEHQITEEGKTRLTPDKYILPHQFHEISIMSTSLKKTHGPVLK
jgi:hypothetical protein